MVMSEEAQADIQKYGYNPKDMPDCFLPDNFDEVSTYMAQGIACWLLSLL